MQLFLKDSKLAIEIGDTVETFRGEFGTVEGMTIPQHEGSTGRIMVRIDGADFASEFFPSVVNAEWRAS